MDRMIALFGSLVTFLGSGQAITILGTIIEAVKAAEKFIQGAKKGEVKKKAVMEVADGMLETIDTFHDGTSEYKEMVKGIISEIIDAVVASYNLTGAWGRKVKITWEGGILE